MLYREIGSAYQVQRDFDFQTIIKGFHIVTEQYTLYPGGLLKVKKYYAWDGPSGGIHTTTFVKSSCIHDILCELINAGKIPMEDQPEVDKQMMLINEKQGMWAPRKFWTYCAVRYYQSRKKKLAPVPVIYEEP